MAAKGRGDGRRPTSSEVTASTPLRGSGGGEGREGRENEPALIGRPIPSSQPREQVAVQVDMCEGRQGGGGCRPLPLSPPPSLPPSLPPW